MIEFECTLYTNKYILRTHNMSLILCLQRNIIYKRSGDKDLSKKYICGNEDLSVLFKIRTTRTDLHFLQPIWAHICKEVTIYL